MIVDSSRDAAPDGDGGALSSPINLAYFYGASPHSSEGSCSPAHSAPGSPGSDSDLSVSSRGGGRRDGRGGARPALQGTAGPGLREGTWRRPRFRARVLSGLSSDEAGGGSRLRLRAASRGLVRFSERRPRGLSAVFRVLSRQRSSTWGEESSTEGRSRGSA